MPARLYQTSYVCWVKADLTVQPVFCWITGLISFSSTVLPMSRSATYCARWASAKQPCPVWGANGNLANTAQALLGRSNTMPLASGCPASSPPADKAQPISLQHLPAWLCYCFALLLVLPVHPAPVQSRPCLPSSSPCCCSGP